MGFFGFAPYANQAMLQTLALRQRQQLIDRQSAAQQVENNLKAAQTEYYTDRGDAVSSGPGKWVQDSNNQWTYVRAPGSRAGMTSGQSADSGAFTPLSSALVRTRVSSEKNGSSSVPGSPST